MLFDLRGRGRRRAVQGIYLGLAVLMGGGLVFFGIGGNTNGGLLDAFKSGNANTSNNSAFTRQIDAAQKQLKVNPSNAGAWAQLARLRFQDASAGGGYDQTTSQFTDSGKRSLGKVLVAWDRYLALRPSRVDADTALLMVQAFAPTGLSKPDRAVQAMEYVIAQRPPSSGLYVQYAQYSYLAGQTRKGQLAADKAVGLALPAQRKTLKTSLDSLKTQAAQQAAQGASGAAGATPQPSTPVTPGG